ncbi:MAG: chromate transporter [Candidatus Bipolaricaulota bacterium]|nr:chromate transporter [Candidatus Bipolaricaulota bacterium]MBS3791422.1 chromate transporter [Candidatus Bipolaricaulota bacterium]
MFRLLIVFLQVGIFSFGGGYAAIPFIEQLLIVRNEWMAYEEFVDIIAIAQMSPGPIAVNSATFVGFNLEKFLGALTATVGVLLLPSIISITLAKYFKEFKKSKYIRGLLKGLRPAVIGLIATAEISIGITAFVGYSKVVIAKNAIIAILIFVFLDIFNQHPIAAIFLSGVLGILLF